MNTDCLPPGRRGTALFFLKKNAAPRRLGGFLFCLALFSCTQKPPAIQPAVYHWETHLALSHSETAYLDSLHCRYLYVKFLDIARDDAKTIRPYALLEVLDSTGLAGRTVVPCVFIANNVFQDIPENQLDWLAQKTAQALHSVGGQFTPNQFPEIQFDCDWTSTTRAAFFSFLKKMRNRLPEHTRLSATIRLHQYKFPDQTGVPPVDRGMLMLYNTGDIDDPEAENSIFQPADAHKYIHGAAATYPLPLDLALPMFSWALVYRDGSLWKIIPEPATETFRDTARYAPFPAGQDKRFLAKQAGYLGGQYLRPGDFLRVENIDTTALRQAAVLAREIDLANDARLAFFHLDHAIVHRYPAWFLTELCETIRPE
ncbi:MAG: hypothetical protein IPM36_03820 [Lewinellaceae bacterium]|nr:hypothetical protein [Lewinellaceae bacterium]